MTPRQAQIVEWLRTEILRRDGYPGDELKRFVVQEFPHFVAVAATVGMKGDEGTAAVLTRKSRQVYIGPRGGLTHYVRGKRRRLPWSDTLPASQQADDPRFQDGYEPPEPHYDQEPTRTLHGAP